MIMNLNAYPTETTFPFTEAQVITLTNNGSVPITYNFDTSVTATGNVTLQPGQSSTDFRTCTVLHVQSSNGIQPIQLELEREISDQFGSLSGISPSYTWNTEKGLRNWRSALAQSIDSSFMPVVVFLGDSITDGTGASGYDSGFVGQFRSAIQLAFGMAGHGFTTAMHNTFSVDSTWVLGYAGTNQYIQSATPTSTNGTFNDSFQDIDILYTTKTDGGTATVQIDGSNVGTINCNGALSYHNKASFHVGTYGKHTVTIIPATTGNTYIEGFIARSGFPGVLVHQVGHPGIKASQYTDPATITASTSAFNPKLTVIMLGTNDFNNVPVSTYQSNLDNIVKNALTTGDVLVMSMGDRFDSASYTYAPYSAYVAAAKQVAVNNGCAYASIYDRWNQSYNWANAASFMQPDGIHPSPKGHTDIVNMLIGILGGMSPNGLMQLVYESAMPYGDVILKNFPNALRILRNMELVDLDGYTVLAQLFKSGTTKNQLVITTNGGVSYAQLALGNNMAFYADSSGNATLNLRQLAISGPTKINLLTKTTLPTASSWANYFCSISDYAVGKTPLVYSDGTVWRYAMDGTAV